MNEPIFSAAGSTSAMEPSRKAHIIVLGNEKGGSGKTTTCMHLTVALLRLGFNVGTMDVDSRQRSFSRYLENRRQTMLKEGVNLPQPHHIVVSRSPFNIVAEAEADDRERFTKALNRLAETNDFIVIDSPGSDTYLARLAHAYADTVITPINDSFVDLDVLATVDGQTMKIVKPSIYSEMMWEQKLLRAKRDGGSIEWIVMRNRLSNIDAKNKRFMTQVTGDLSRRIGFRVAPGFSERVIFREMFLQGLTVLDIMEAGGGKAGLSLSHVAARQEVRDLMRTLKISRVDEKLSAIIAKDEGEAEKKIEAKKEEAAREPTLGLEDKPAMPAMPTLGTGTSVEAPTAPVVSFTSAAASETKPTNTIEDQTKSVSIPLDKLLEELAS
jgi:chromosome partitioning protein